MAASNQDRSSKYSFWTWLVAIILAIILFWQWQHGDGFSRACCATPAPVAAPAPFSFIASSTEAYTAQGDATGITWVSKTQALTDWLKNGTDWKVVGDASKVTLTGTVDSEATKQARGAEAQAFFGETVTVDNQLTILAPPVAVATAPPAAKVYFDTAKTALPTDVNQNLSAIVDWAKANPDSKVVISGFHDPRGSHAMNAMLAKNRATSVHDYLVNAGIDSNRIELRKPQNIEGGEDLNEARRAEVSIE